MNEEKESLIRQEMRITTLEKSFDRLTVELGKLNKRFTWLLIVLVGSSFVPDATLAQIASQIL